jgi:hypothetical protein
VVTLVFWSFVLAVAPVTPRLAWVLVSGISHGITVGIRRVLAWEGALSA